MKEIVKINSTWTTTGCSGPRAMRGHCGKAPQLNSKQISANYLTLITNLEPAMRASRKRENRRERAEEICKIEAASCGERVSQPALFTLCLSPVNILKRCWCYRIAWEVLHFHFHERFFLHFPRLICIFMYKSVKRVGRARNASQVIDFACLLGSSPTPKGICILTPPMRGAMAGDDDVDAAAIAIAGRKRQSTKTMFFSPSTPTSTQAPLSRSFQSKFCASTQSQSAIKP